MTSIDDLFKSRLASRPAQNTPAKRKIADESPAAQKAARTALNSDAKGGQHATVAEEEEQDLSEGEAGPNRPLSDAEQDLDDGEDEEGRFFGGGVTRHTADVLNYMDAADDGEARSETIDGAWLKRTALNFERRITKNQELRAKHEDDPAKFIDSEADLDADIKALSILAEHTELYADFARLGCAGSLVSLLAHENTDIAINAIEILAELTDLDVAAEGEQWDALIDAMLEADVADLLIQNFARLDEREEADRAGVYHSLGLLENLLSQPATAEKILGKEELREPLLKWLDERTGRADKSMSQNKQYAAELLAISLQSSHHARASYVSADGVDHILQRLAPYRKHDPPKQTEEEEFVENQFDALTALADTNSGKRDFRAKEGIELMLIMLREGGKLAKPRALGVLDHALSRATASTTPKLPADDEEELRAESVRTCEAFVDAAGLKPLFGTLMRATEANLTEHALGILASLMRSLPGASAQRIRTLAKCVEKKYQVLGRLVKLRTDYGAKLLRVNAEIAAEKDSGASGEDEAGEWLSRRLDAGLFSFQTIDVILAWLVAEDSGAKAELVRLLQGSGRDETLEDVRTTLTEQLAGLEGSNDADDVDAADMLRTLVELLQ